MKYFGKNVSILIISNGYWRSRFFQKLFTQRAHIRRIDVSKEKISLKPGGWDLIMWENGIPGLMQDRLPSEKLVLFDYRDEGNETGLASYAEKLGLPKARRLLLLSHDPKVGCLPAPPPKVAPSPSSLPLGLRGTDIFFLCSATYLYSEEVQELPYFINRNGVNLYNQRLEWAEQLSKSAMLGKNRGIIRSPVDYLSETAIRKLFNYSSPGIFVDPIPKSDYLKSMQNSKIVLCPVGHSRWTYRHMEAMFYGALVVSCCFKHTRMLPPIPLEACVCIEDGQFKPSQLSDILSQIDLYQAKADAGRHFAREIFRPSSLFTKGGYRRQAIRKLFDAFMNFFE